MTFWCFVFATLFALGFGLIAAILTIFAITGQIPFYKAGICWGVCFFFSLLSIIPVYIEQLKN